MPEAPADAARLRWRASTAGLPLYRAARWSAPTAPLDLRRFEGDYGVLLHAAGPPSDEVLECAVPAGREHAILLVLDAVGQRLTGSIGGERFETVPQPGQMLVVPAGAESRWRSLRGRSRTLHLHMAPDAIAAIAEENGLAPQAAGLRPASDLRDAGTPALLQAMQARLAAGRPGPAFLRHWAALAAVIALRGAVPEVGSRPLSAQRLLAVRAHVEAHLAGPIDLDGMAAAAGLSRFHFVRAFRRATGLTPLAYVASRRIACAKSLLREGRMSLAEVALACGFAGQSQFTHAFRRLAGTTPGRWRAGEG